MPRLTISLDNNHLDARLAALAELAERSPELAEGLVCAFEAGEQLFVIDANGLPAGRADRLVVRLQPSDRLRGLLAAVGTRYEDLGLIEH